MIRKYRFVLHDHYATNHHYDLRLEKYGTLKSWALPKGMPQFVGDRKLAIQTPNHPISYINFKGNIPTRHYGAGKVLIADNGYYTPIAWERDKIKFKLYGKIYKGIYIIIPFKRNYLVIRGEN